MFRVLRLIVAIGDVLLKQLNWKRKRFDLKLLLLICSTGQIERQKLMGILSGQRFNLRPIAAIVLFKQRNRK